MKNILIKIIIIISIYPLLACSKSQNKSLEVDNKSYINNFELLQENSKNDTRIKISSPKAN